MKKKLVLLFVLSMLCVTSKAVWAVTASPEEMIQLENWVEENLGTDVSEMPFSFILNGQYSSDIIGNWKKRADSRKLDENRTLKTISFTDSQSGLKVTVEATIYRDFPAIEWVLHLKNTGKKDTPIIDNIMPLSDSLIVAETTPVLHYSKGALCCIQDYEPVEKKLETNTNIHLQPGGGRSSSEILPFFNIDMGSKGTILGVGWTGEWAANFKRSVKDNVFMQSGMALTHLKLHPGEEIRTPRILLMFWQGNSTVAPERQWLRGNNLLRRFILTHHRPQVNGKPMTLPVILATWGGWTAEEHFKHINKIIDYDIPVQLYWIDAEWFGKSEWRSQAGDWQVKHNLYPQEFQPFTQKLHKSDRDFLLWFELFRICKGTPWYQFKNKEGCTLELNNAMERYQQWRTGTDWPVPHDDPQWIHCESRRSQMTEHELLLNLGNDDARKFLTDFLSQKINEWGLDWYREDANIAPIEYWHEADEIDRQGMTEIRYIEGLYKFWDDLLARFPHLQIDNCASGGRRIDLETIGRSVPLHRTDWGRSAIHAQCHSFGLFHWVPLHTAGRSAMLAKGNEYEIRSIMTAGLSVQLWDPNQGDKSQETKDVLKQYADVQKYYYGDYYPLTPYSQENTAWLAWQFDLPEEGEGMIQAFRRENSVYESSRLQLTGLQPDAQYVVTDVDTGKQDKILGKELVETGLLVSITKQPGSALIKYKKQN